MADNVSVVDGEATFTHAADEIGGVIYPRVKVQVGADGSATDFLHKASRSDTYTGTGTGTAVNVSTQGMSRFAIQVKGTGASATSWTVVLEVSLDGTNYTTLITHDNTNGSDGSVMFAPSGASPTPVLYFRSRCTSLTLGSATNIVVTIVGMH